ncbi:hypothetical protein HMPREF0290_0903 [Corynebacterium efficiens YS-314]|nr:hypothetical protein HMPREF0290_0903 [Corynebacterium efficiens YS-314]
MHLDYLKEHSMLDSSQAGLAQRSMNYRAVLNKKMSPMPKAMHTMMTMQFLMESTPAPKNLQRRNLQSPLMRPGHRN